MLIIERRAGELIQIGDEIRLCVLDTDGETVRLGVVAPRDLPVQVVTPKGGDAQPTERSAPDQAAPAGQVTHQPPGVGVGGGLPADDNSV